MNNLTDTERRDTYILLLLRMVTNDFNIPGFASSPLKTNAPLIIDADTVLTTTLTLEFFESMARDSLHFILCPLLSALPA